VERAASNSWWAFWRIGALTSTKPGCSIGLIQILWIQRLLVSSRRWLPSFIK
jgi:hypothetical protein